MTEWTTEDYMKMSRPEDLLKENKQLKEELKLYQEPFELIPTYHQLQKKLNKIEASFENDGICCVRCYGLSRKRLRAILKEKEK